METKAIITKRNAGQRNAGSVTEANEVERAGLKVESELPDGTLVNGEENALLGLESQGYRVKLLRNTNLLKIGAHVIDTQIEPEASSRAAGIVNENSSGWDHHLVQLIAPPKKEWVDEIIQQGVDVIEPVSAYGLYVVGNPAKVASLKNLQFVSWTGPFLPEYRISPNLAGQQGLLKINILTVALTAEDDTRSNLERHGVQIEEDVETLSAYKHPLVKFRGQAAAESIPEIARIPEVRWIELEPEKIPEDERSAQIVAESLDGTQTQPVLGYNASLTAVGLTGAGVTVAISDTGVDTNNNASLHVDLNGRLAFSLFTAGTSDTNGHGTHVAGIVAGNAASGETDPQGFLLGQGVAPGSRIGSLSSGNAENIIPDAANNSSQVMNMSWQVNLPGTGYSAQDSDFDRHARDANPDAGVALENVVLVFSAGNSGPGATTTTKESKNSILVGNSLNFRPGEGAADNIMGLRASSSRGPAVDGRILPTIVAPGTDIVSTRSSAATGSYTDTGGANHTNYIQMSGTSMAAPHVSGLCALLIEWWRNRSGGRNPSTALIKALLINGAIDIAGGPDGNGGNLTNIPNNDQGWGRVSLQNMVLQAPASDRGPKIFSDQRHAFTAAGQEHTLNISPVDTGRPLRITLVWTDAEGAAGDNPALVNDLDLEVVEIATGLVFKGNVFNNGFSQTGGVFDNINNQECVYINNPSGLYQVNIIAATIAASAHPAVATPWQDFALVIDNAEYAASSPVNVVPVIDRSGSMIAYGYVDATRTGSSQFVDLVNINDALGIVSFGDSSIVEYDNAGSLQVVTGQPVKDAAGIAVTNISFGGCTYMGAGIQEAGNLLGTASGTKAMVLLSDGYDNKGCDPGNPAKPSALDAVAALPSDISIYSCAMGPMSDQVLLEQLATDTDGRYYFMPAIDDLFEIYNYIRGQVSGDSIIVNESAMASSSRVAGFVDSYATSVTFTVAWGNTDLRYVPNEPKKRTEISIRLRDPRGKLLNANDASIRRITGDGYAIFSIQDPVPGQWYIEVSTALRTHTRYTVGGFVDSPIRLVHKIDIKNVFADKPFSMVTSVFFKDDIIDQVRGSLSLSTQTHPLDRIADKYKDQLKKIRPHKALVQDGVPDLIARLSELRTLILDKDRVDILGMSSRNRKLVSDSTGKLSAGFTPVNKGSYNLALNISGNYNRTRFIRKDMVSILAK